MMVTVAAILILSMVTTNVFGLGQVPFRTGPPDPPPTVRLVQPTATVVQRAEVTRSPAEIAANRPRDLRVGAVVQVTRDFPPFLEPTAGRSNDDSVPSLMPGSFVEIAGEWERAANGEIWWPVFHEPTGQRGYILQGALIESAPRG